MFFACADLTAFAVVPAVQMACCNVKLFCYLAPLREAFIRELTLMCVFINM
jgi:hypothetical protein